MRILLLSLGLLLGLLSPAAAQGVYLDRGYGGYDGWSSPGARSYARARVWVEDDRDYFRHGDRLRVRFSTSDDAYVALIHVDSDGNLDFLYPASPWDDDFVRGGRVHSLPRGFQSSGWMVRGGSGIGYLYLIASPVPLDYSYFVGRRAGPWDWSHSGRMVRGDPFWAFEQLTRFLVPDPYVPYVADYYSYHVGGRHRYPSYACGDYGYGGGWAWGYGSAYGSCDRLDLFLRQHPYYYDTRLYRGDRRMYFRDRYGDRYYENWNPPHGYKERVERAPARGYDRVPQRSPVPRTVAPESRTPATREARPQPRDERERVTVPERRPALERRGTEPAAGASARPATGRASGVPAAGRRAPQAAPARERPESTRRATPARTAEPRTRRPSGGEDTPAQREPGR